MKSKTLWWIIGLGVLSLLAWIGIRSFRNHRRMEEELSEYEGQGAPVIESPPLAQQPATEPASEGASM